MRTDAVDIPATAVDCSRQMPAQLAVLLARMVDRTARISAGIGTGRLCRA